MYEWLVDRLIEKKVIDKKTKGYVFFDYDKSNSYMNTLSDYSNRVKRYTPVYITALLFKNKCARVAPYLRQYLSDSTRSIMAYVNIPFCRAKCDFCHYHTHIIDHDTKNVIGRYVESIKKEIKIFKTLMGINFNIPFLAIGGGTPLYMPEESLYSLVSFINDVLPIGNSIKSIETTPLEICMESGDEKLNILRTFGFDRMSIGIQSLDDNLLQLIGCKHTRCDVSTIALERVRKHHFRHINIDLMYGFPFGVEHDALKKTFDFIDAYQPESISLYRFNYSSTSQLAHELSESIDLHTVFSVLKEYDTFLKDRNYSKFGRHYTKSCGDFFAKEEPVHKWLVYGGDWWGSGANARSFIGDVGFRNVKDAEIYCDILRREIIPIAYHKHLSDAGKIKKYIATHMFDNQGINKDDFYNTFNHSFDQLFKAQIRKLLRLDLIIQEDNGIRINDNNNIFDREILKTFIKQNVKL